MRLCILTFLQSIVMGLAYASTGVFRSVTPLLGKLVVGYFQILSSSLFLHLSFSFFFFKSVSLASLHYYTFHMH